MEYIVDVENKRLVSSFTSTRTATPESAVFGDTPDISVRLVESNEASNANPWRYVDLTGSSIRVAIGNPGGDPTSGTFTLTFSGDTTTALNYNATASEVDTALNALASMVTAGGCTVTDASAGYQVTFDSTGDQALITATTDSLSPSSSAYIYEATTGDGSTNEVQVVTLEVDNAAYIELTTDIASPSATVTVVREGVTDTTSELQRVQIGGDPYLGTWAVTINGNTSEAIAVDATLAEITTAIEGITGIGADNVTVTGSTLDFTIQYASSLGNVATATIDVANLTGAVGKTGSIDLNTNQFLELLAGASSAQATLEIVKYDTGNSTSDTVYQGNITCQQDVIPDTPASITPLPSYASASHTHTESDITDLGTATTLNADTSLVGNAWFLDDDTMAANDAEKVPSQQSVKAYVDASAGASQLSDLSDVNTSTPTDKNVLVGDGVDFESRPLVEADISDLGTYSTASSTETLTNKTFDANGTGNSLSNVDVADLSATGTPSGTTYLRGDNTWSTVPTGTPEGTAILSTGETGGTKYLREDGDGTCSWQAVAGGGLSNVVEDTTPQLGGDLDTNGNAIVTLSNNNLELSPNGTGSVLKTANSTIQRNGNFSTAGDAQAESFVLRGTSTTSSATEIFIDGSSERMVIPTDSAWTFEALVVGRANDANECAGYKVTGCIDNNAGTVALVGTNSEDFTNEDTAGWSVAFTADNTNNALKCEVTAQILASDVKWVAYVKAVQVTNPDTY